MITQLRHIGVVVNDFDACVHFYKDMLGLEVRAETDEYGSYIDALLGFKDMRVKTIKLKTPQGGAVELLYYYSPTSPQRPPCTIHARGITHMALTIEGLDEVYERLSQKGVKFISSPQLAPGGKVKVAFCQDPEGNYIELAEEVR